VLLEEGDFYDFVRQTELLVVCFGFIVVCRLLPVVIVYFLVFYFILFFLLGVRPADFLVAVFSCSGGNSEPEQR